MAEWLAAPSQQHALPHVTLQPPVFGWQKHYCVTTISLFSQFKETMKET
jgi:hypothetical protein